MTEPKQFTIDATEAGVYERVEIHQPVSWSSRSPASVIVRTVSLPHLAARLGPDRAHILELERRLWANVLVGLVPTRLVGHHPGNVPSIDADAR